MSGAALIRKCCCDCPGVACASTHGCVNCSGTTPTSYAVAFGVGVLVAAGTYEYGPGEFVTIGGSLAGLEFPADQVVAGPCTWQYFIDHDFPLTITLEIGAATYVQSGFYVFVRQLDFGGGDIETEINVYVTFASPPSDYRGLIPVMTAFLPRPDKCCTRTVTFPLGADPDFDGHNYVYADEVVVGPCA
jgi:hypothetical protein